MTNKTRRFHMDLAHYTNIKCSYGPTLPPFPPPHHKKVIKVKKERNRNCYYSGCFKTNTLCMVANCVSSHLPTCVYAPFSSLEL